MCRENKQKNTYSRPTISHEAQANMQQTCDKYRHLLNKRTQSSKDKVPCVLMDNYKHLRKHVKRSPARYKGIFRAEVAPGVKYFPFSVMAFEI